MGSIPRPAGYQACDDITPNEGVSHRHDADAWMWLCHSRQVKKTGLQTDTFHTILRNHLTEVTVVTKKILSKHK